MQMLVLDSGDAVAIRIPLTIEGDRYEAVISNYAAIVAQCAPDAEGLTELRRQTLAILHGYSVEDWSDIDCELAMQGWVTEAYNLPARPERRHFEAMCRIYGIADAQGIDTDIAIAMTTIWQLEGKPTLKVIEKIAREARLGTAEELVEALGSDPNGPPELRRRYLERHPEAAQNGR